MIMQPAPDSGLAEDFIIPIPQLSSAVSPSIVYVSFTRETPSEYTLASFQCTLKFISKELDPSSGEPEEEGYEDEYQLEEVELGAGGDYIVPNYVNFSTEWDRLRTFSTATETFALSAMDSIKGTQSYRSFLRSTSLTRRLGSCCRLHCRDSQHGGPWWHGEPLVVICAHFAAFWPRYWRRWEGPGAKSDDVLFRARCHT